MDVNQQNLANFLRHLAEEVEVYGVVDEPTVSMERPVERDADAERQAHNNAQYFKHTGEVKVTLRYRLGRQNETRES